MNEAEREKRRAQKPLILQMYREGEKVSWIAEVNQCSTSYASKIAIANGLRRRTRIGPRK